MRNHAVAGAKWQGEAPARVANLQVTLRTGSPARGHPATTAAALANIAVIEKENFVARVRTEAASAISTPLVITHAEIDQFFNSVGKGLDRLWD